MQSMLSLSAFDLKVSEIDKHIDIIKNSKIFLTQLEVPKDVTLHCLKIAKENGCLTILNLHLHQKLQRNFITILILSNETEESFILV